MAADNSVSDEQISKVERDACPTCGSCSGMFTANSMNCLAEALGLALPGNGTILATHANRRRLFEEAAARIVEMTYDYYKNGNENVLPRNIATKRLSRMQCVWILPWEAQPIPFCTFWPLPLKARLILP